jgi:2-hydroxy-3-keto-5-methylthiopentenyl-1-phosphate phosphatase
MAREADQVFARGSLLEWCRSEGRAVAEFEDFDALAGQAYGARMEARP